MSYYIDLSKISIKNYQEKLKSSYLPPSRMILKENNTEELNYFNNLGIKNIQDLLKVLKDKQKFSEINSQNIFPNNYLTILLRELNSILPKPIKLSDFKNISKDAIVKLEAHKIKNTIKLFDKILTPESREELSHNLNISKEDIMKLTRLTDLSRVRWVGATFAWVLLELGVDTVEKLSKSNPIELHIRVNLFNKEKATYKAQIGLNDIRIVVDLAKEISFDIVYE
jgi:hypothetical protein